MPRQIRIITEGIELSAELNDSKTAKTIESMLPMELTMSRWGDEYYGNCGIHTDPSEDATDIMEVGDLAVWPIGSALCIFFGPTPASKGSEPRAASPVNPVGKLKDDPSLFKEFGNTIKVRIEG